MRAKIQPTPPVIEKIENFELWKNIFVNFFKMGQPLTTETLYNRRITQKGTKRDTLSKDLMRGTTFYMGGTWGGRGVL